MLSKLLKIEFDPAKRVYGLDILRALAILSVMFAHGGKLLPPPLAKINEAIMPDGVFLFFVLSGFLIGGILIKVLESHKATPKTLVNFWIRRWFRTIPNYFLILTTLIIIGHLFYAGAQGADTWRYYLFFQNFNFPHPQFFSEAWTLSVEEWFYLLIPSMIFILIGLFKIPTKKAILTTVACVALASITALIQISFSSS